MPTITFQPAGKILEVEVGTSLFDAAKMANLPVASSCSASFICGKCNMQILSGHEYLSPQTEIEVVLLKREKKALTDRISCFTRVLGDCTVTTRYW